MNNSRQSANRDWLFGAAIAIGCGVVYFASRPPLYHNDGYRDRLYAIQPNWFYNANPHHLLWNFVDALIGTMATWLGHPTTIAFQAVGIVLNCLTIFFFFVLLRKISRSAIFAAASALLIAFSPNFWQFGLENRPYSLLFVVLVLYLWLWYSEDGGLPSGWRLFAAGFLLLILALLQQGAILLIPAAVVVQVANSTDRSRRLISASTWGASIAATVVLLYIVMWALTRWNIEGFFHWVAGFAVYVHPPNIFYTAAWLSAVKSVMGIFGALLQPAKIITFLSQTFSANMVLAIYGAGGILTCLAIGSAIWSRRLDRPLLQLTRNSPLFALSLLSILFWSALIFAWQPRSSEYWVLTLFPALICLGMLVRERPGRWLWVFATAVVVISVWNIHFNRENDRDLSVNFPEPLLAAIDQHVGPRGIFIVLANDDSVGSLDYDLLFECLNYAPRNPGIAILNDLVAPAWGKGPWTDQLREKIDSTLDSGGQVFVESDVFNPDSYADFTGAKNPFASFVDTRLPPVDGAVLHQQVKRFFDSYELKNSQFKLGENEFLAVGRRSKVGAVSKTQ